MTQLDDFSHRERIEEYSAYLSPDAQNPDEELWMALLQAGAHMRALDQAQAAGLFDQVADFSPRSIVLVTSGDNALRAAQFILGVCGQYLDCPVTIISELPLWVGALDIVIVLGDSEDDPAILPILELAAKRAGSTIISFPETGRITEAARSLGSVIIPPLLFQSSLTAAYMYSMWRHISILVAFFRVIQPKIGQAIGKFDELVAYLDETAHGVSPQMNHDFNIARSLADNLRNRALVFVFTSDGTAALAAHAQKQLFILAETMAAVSGFIPWCQRQFHRNPSALSAVDEVFYDPYLDSPVRLPERAILFTSSPYRDTHISYAKSYGDIRGIIDIPHRAVKLEIDAMEDLLASIIIIDAAILFLRKDINSSAL